MKKNKLILIGTNNKGKFKELSYLLPKKFKKISPLKLKIKSPIESGKSFLANSKIKANYFVLSSGAIENARILLNNEHKYKILRNNNTGRYFMDHLRVNLGTLKSNRKLPLSILFGIKNNYFEQLLLVYFNRYKLSSVSTFTKKNVYFIIYNHFANLLLTKIEK